MATPSTYTPGTYTPGPLVCTCGGGLDTRVYHDAQCPIRLIAAAPEILQALATLLDIVHSDAMQARSLYKGGHIKADIARQLVANLSSRDETKAYSSARALLARIEGNIEGNTHV